MKILLDTHIWLWFNLDPDSLNVQARQLLKSPEHKLYLSVGSIWEIAIKYQSGKMDLPMVPQKYIPSRLKENDIDELSITMNHCLAAASLPIYHKDPFDRLLIAQAQEQQLKLMTADTHIKQYDVDLLWAI